MGTTIRSDISSPSTSDNNPRLSYIWMYVSWDRYRDTYLDIWVRRVIIIIIDNRYGSYTDSRHSSHDFSHVSSRDPYYDFRDSCYIYSYDS